jgi:hypothetical protein
VDSGDVAGCMEKLYYLILSGLELQPLDLPARTQQLYRRRYCGALESSLILELNTKSQFLYVSVSGSNMTKKLAVENDNVTDVCMALTFPIIQIL